MSTLAEAASRVASVPLDGIRAAGAGLRIVALVVLAATVLTGAYLSWVRDLPLFSVGSVEVVGTEDGLIVSTLTSVAREMTTLHDRHGRLDEVAARFPVISEVHAETSFPTGMRIVVEVRDPVAFARIDGRAVPVSADGVLLEGVRAPGNLPTVPAEAENGRLGGPAVDQVRVIGAAPGPLLALIEVVGTTKASGITIGLEGGVEVRFGTPAAAARKWAAAAAVLADDQISGLTYIDVSAPERPAVGGAIGGPPIEIEVDVAPVEPTGDATVAPETSTDAPDTGATAPGVSEAPSETVPVAPETAPPAPEQAPAGGVSLP
jgi:cell division septal protein FtsQ